MIKYTALFGLLILSSSTYPLITGYNHLYNRHSNTIVDILYDAHEPQAGLDAEGMKKLPFDRIKPKLYQTEQRLLDALDVLNKKAPGQIDIVWEHGLYECGDSSFIGFPEQLVKNQYKHLTLISSDLCRDAFQDLLCQKGARTVKKELAGVSFANPMPVSDEDLAAICSTYGEETLYNFNQLRSKTIERLAHRYSKRYHSGTTFKRKHFKKNSFDALADCEMLRNVLSSHKPHIIIYCGAWHSERIYDFLSNSAGFKEVGKQLKFREAEIDTKHLASLDKEYRTLPWQPTKTGSSFYDTVEYDGSACDCPEC